MCWLLAFNMQAQLSTGVLGLYSITAVVAAASFTPRNTSVQLGPAWGLLWRDSFSPHIAGKRHFSR